MKRIFSIILLFIFLAQTLFTDLAIAQVLPLPTVNAVQLTQPFTPALVRGLSIYPDNPLKFDFIIDAGDDKFKNEDFKQESMKLIKYFLTSLTIPENDMWVNLNPAEKDRIISKEFGETEMGRDMLAQDYLLKQLTASLLNPDEKLGKEFWEKIYEASADKFGKTDIAMNTLSKVWIIPDKAQVYVKDNSVYVVESHLKVLMEEDYKSGQWTVNSEQRKNSQSTVHSTLFTEIIIPALEKEINEGKNFALLRQIQNSAILAAWYKKNLKETLLGKEYVDQKKTQDIQSGEVEAAQKIYHQYLEAFKKGAYEMVKDEYNPATQEVISRKYVSGGVVAAFGNALRDGAMSADELAHPRPVQKVTWGLEDGQNDMAVPEKKDVAMTVRSADIPFMTQDYINGLYKFISRLSLSIDYVHGLGLQHFVEELMQVGPQPYVATENGYVSATSFKSPYDFMQDVYKRMNFEVSVHSELWLVPGVDQAVEKWKEEATFKEGMVFDLLGIPFAEVRGENIWFLQENFKRLADHLIEYVKDRFNLTNGKSFVDSPGMLDVKQQIQKMAAELRKPIGDEYPSKFLWDYLTTGNNDGSKDASYNIPLRVYQNLHSRHNYTPQYVTSQESRLLIERFVNLFGFLPWEKGKNVFQIDGDDLKLFGIKFAETDMYAHPEIADPKYHPFNVINIDQLNARLADMIEQNYQAMTDADPLAQKAFGIVESNKERVFGKANVWKIIFKQGVDRAEAWMDESETFISEIRDRIGGERNAWTIMMGLEKEEIIPWILERKEHVEQMATEHSLPLFNVWKYEIGRSGIDVALTAQAGDHVIDPQTGELSYQGANSEYEPKLKTSNRIIAMRHGETGWNKKTKELLQSEGADALNRFYMTVSEEERTALSRLSDDGKKQAREGARLLFDKLKIDFGEDLEKWRALVIVASGMERTQETAQFFIDLVKEETAKFPSNVTGEPVVLKMHIDERANEITHGETTGLSEMELADYEAALAEYQKTRSAVVKTSVGESFKDVIDRNEEMFKELDQLYSGQTILLFGHERELNAVKTLFGHINLLKKNPEGKDYVDYRKFYILNATPFMMYSPDQIKYGYDAIRKHFEENGLTPFLAEEKMKHWAKHPQISILKGGQYIKGSSEDEFLALGDEDGKVLTGTETKLNVHAKGLWHFTAHNYIFDQRGRVLLQIRSKAKKQSPGKLQVSVSGHVDAGETPEQAVAREGVEEIGIVLPEGRAKKVGQYSRSQNLDDGENNEHVHVYRSVVDDDELAEIQQKFNLNESDELWMIPPDILKEMVRDVPEAFSNTLKDVVRDDNPFWERIVVQDSAMTVNGTTIPSGIQDFILSARKTVTELLYAYTPDQSYHVIEGITDVIDAFEMGPYVDISKFTTPQQFMRKVYAGLNNKGFETLDGLIFPDVEPLLERWDSETEFKEGMVFVIMGVSFAEVRDGKIWFLRNHFGELAEKIANYLKERHGLLKGKSAVKSEGVLDVQRSASIWVAILRNLTRTEHIAFVTELERTLKDVSRLKWSRSNMQYLLNEESEAMNKWIGVRLGFLPWERGETVFQIERNNLLFLGVKVAELGIKEGSSVVNVEIVVQFLAEEIEERYGVADAAMIAQDDIDYLSGWMQQEVTSILKAKKLTVTAHQFTGGILFLLDAIVSGNDFEIEFFNFLSAIGVETSDDFLKLKNLVTALQDFVTGKITTTDGFVEKLIEQGVYTKRSEAKQRVRFLSNLAGKSKAIIASLDDRTLRFPDNLVPEFSIIKHPAREVKQPKRDPFLEDLFQPDRSVTGKPKIVKDERSGLSIDVSDIDFFINKFVTSKFIKKFSDYLTGITQEQEFIQRLSTLLDVTEKPREEILKAALADLVREDMALPSKVTRKDVEVLPFAKGLLKKVRETALMIEFHHFVSPIDIAPNYRKTRTSVLGLNYLFSELLKVEEPYLSSPQLKKMNRKYQEFLHRRMKSLDEIFFMSGYLSFDEQSLIGISDDLFIQKAKVNRKEYVVIFYKNGIYEVDENGDKIPGSENPSRVYRFIAADNAVELEKYSKVAIKYFDQTLKPAMKESQAYEFKDRLERIFGKEGGEGAVAERRATDQTIEKVLEMLGVDSTDHPDLPLGGMLGIGQSSRDRIALLESVPAKLLLSGPVDENATSIEGPKKKKEPTLDEIINQYFIAPLEELMKRADDGNLRELTQEEIRAFFKKAVQVTLTHVKEERRENFLYFVGVIMQALQDNNMDFEISHGQEGEGVRTDISFSNLLDDVKSNVIKAAAIPRDGKTWVFTEKDRSIYQAAHLLIRALGIDQKIKMIGRRSFEWREDDAITNILQEAYYKTEVSKADNVSDADKRIDFHNRLLAKLYSSYKVDARFRRQIDRMRASILRDLKLDEGESVRFVMDSFWAALAAEFALRTGEHPVVADPFVFETMDEKNVKDEEYYFVSVSPLIHKYQDEVSSRISFLGSGDPFIHENSFDGGFSYDPTPVSDLVRSLRILFTYQEAARFLQDEDNRALTAKELEIEKTAQFTLPDEDFTRPDETEAYSKMTMDQLFKALESTKHEEWRKHQETILHRFTEIAMKGGIKAPEFLDSLENMLRSELYMLITERVDRDDYQKKLEITRAILETVVRHTPMNFLNDDVLLQFYSRGASLDEQENLVWKNKKGRAEDILNRYADRDYENGRWGYFRLLDLIMESYPQRLGPKTMSLIAVMVKAAKKRYGFFLGDDLGFGEGAYGLANVIDDPLSSFDHHPEYFAKLFLETPGFLKTLRFMLHPKDHVIIDDRYSTDDNEDRDVDPFLSKTFLSELIRQNSLQGAQLEMLKIVLDFAPDMATNELLKNYHKFDFSKLKEILNEPTLEPKHFEDMERIAQEFGLNNIGVALFLAINPDFNADAAKKMDIFLTKEDSVEVAFSLLYAVLNKRWTVGEIERLYQTNLWKNASGMIRHQNIGKVLKIKQKDRSKFFTAFSGKELAPQNARDIYPLNIPETHPLYERYAHEVRAHSMEYSSFVADEQMIGPPVKEGPGDVSIRVNKRARLLFFDLQKIMENSQEEIERRIHKLSEFEDKKVEMDNSAYRLFLLLPNEHFDELFQMMNDNLDELKSYKANQEKLGALLKQFLRINPNFKNWTQTQVVAYAVLRLGLSGRRLYEKGSKEAISRAYKAQMAQNNLGDRVTTGQATEEENAQFKTLTVLRQLLLLVSENIRVFRNWLKAVPDVETDTRRMLAPPDTAMIAGGFDLQGVERDLPVVQKIIDALSSEDLEPFLIVGGGASGKEQQLVTALHHAGKTVETFNLRNWTFRHLGNQAIREWLIEDANLNPEGLTYMSSLEDKFSQLTGSEDEIRRQKLDILRKDYRMPSSGIKMAEAALLQEQLDQSHADGTFTDGVTPDMNEPNTLRKLLNSSADVILFDEFDLSADSKGLNESEMETIRLLSEIMADFRAKKQVAAVVHPAARNDEEVISILTEALGEAEEIDGEKRLKEIEMEFLPEQFERLALKKVGITDPKVVAYVKSQVQGLMSFYLSFMTQDGEKRILDELRTKEINLADQQKVAQALIDREINFMRDQKSVTFDPLPGEVKAILIRLAQNRQGILDLSDPKQNELYAQLLRTMFVKVEQQEEENKIKIIMPPLVQKALEKETQTSEAVDPDEKTQVNIYLERDHLRIAYSPEESRIIDELLVILLGDEQLDEVKLNQKLRELKRQWYEAPAKDDSEKYSFDSTLAEEVFGKPGGFYKSAQQFFDAFMRLENYSEKAIIYYYILSNLRRHLSNIGNLHPPEEVVIEGVQQKVLVDFVIAVRVIPFLVKSLMDDEKLDGEIVEESQYENFWGIEPMTRNSFYKMLGDFFGLDLASFDRTSVQRGIFDDMEDGYQAQIIRALMNLQPKEKLIDVLEKVKANATYYDAGKNLDKVLGVIRKEKTIAEAVNEDRAMAADSNFQAKYMLDPNKIYNLSPQFLSAVKYFNDEILRLGTGKGIREFTKEDLRKLFDLFTTERDRREYVINETSVFKRRDDFLESFDRQFWSDVTYRDQDFSLEDLLKIINEDMNIFSFDVVIAKVVDIYDRIRNMDSYKGSFGLTTWKGGYGTRRLAWFVLNYMLIRNEYPPYYFEDNKDMTRSAAEFYNMFKEFLTKERRLVPLNLSRIQTEKLKFSVEFKRLLSERHMGFSGDININKFVDWGNEALLELEWGSSPVFFTKVYLRFFINDQGEAELLKVFVQLPSGIIVPMDQIVDPKFILPEGSFFNGVSPEFFEQMKVNLKYYFKHRDFGNEDLADNKLQKETKFVILQPEGRQFSRIYYRVRKDLLENDESYTDPLSKIKFVPVDLKTENIDFKPQGIQRLDAAMIAQSPGGIDLNANKSIIEEQGGKMKFNLPQTQPSFQNQPINRFIPVIIQISPPTTIPFLLGLNTSDEPSENMHLSSVN